MKSENLFRRMLLVGVLLGTAKLVTGSDSEIGRPSLKEIRRVATENAIKSASLDIKEGGTRDSKSISRGIDFDLLTAASKGFNQEEMAAYFSAYIEKYMQEIVRLGEPLAGPIPRYGPRQQLVNAQAYLNCRFQLIRRPNDFQPHYASIKSRLNAAFSVKSLNPRRDECHPVYELIENDSYSQSGNCKRQLASVVVFRSLLPAPTSRCDPLCKLRSECLATAVFSGPLASACACFLSISRNEWRTLDWLSLRQAMWKSKVGMLGRNGRNSTSTGRIC